MKSVNTESRQAATAVKSSVSNDKALKLLASSIFRQLREEGCEPRDIISVSSQLIDLVTHEISKDEPSQM